VNVRVQPNPVATRIFTANLGQAMDVMDQQLGVDNQRWFQVTVEFEEAVVTGWVRADLVKALGDPCPPLGSR
jgi:hypothetical protein